MPADTIERVAEHQDRTYARIVKRFNPELIARTKQLFVWRVPNGKGKIAAQVRETPRTPFRISLKYQLGVRERIAAARRKIKFIQQLHAAVEPRIRRDPKSPVETSGLPFVLRLAGRPQEGMSETNRRVSPTL